MTAKFNLIITSLILFVSSTAFAVEQIYDAPMLHHNRPNAKDTEFGDFNNDGITDIVQGQSYSAMIMFYLGNGDGTFQTLYPYAINNYVSVDYVAVGDVNNDGLDDVVALSPNFTSFVCIYLSDITSSDVTHLSTTPIAIDVGSFMHRLELADEDNDGNLDIILGGDYEGILALYNNGDSTFSGVTNLGVGPTLYLNCADLNQDDYPDFVNYYSAVTVTLSDGAGGYQVPDTINFIGSLYGSIMLFDLNGDGELDVTYTGTDNSNYWVEVAANQGDGVFADPVAYDIFPAGHKTFTVGNIFGDNYNDIITTHSEIYDYHYTVINNTGGFSFAAPVEYVADYRPGTFYAYDFNGDGYDDMLNGAWSSMGIYINHGDGTFPTENYINVTGGDGRYSMKETFSADFNGDSYPDIVIFGASGTSTLLTEHFFRIFYNDGSGQFDGSSDEFILAPFADYYRGTIKDYLIIGDFIGDNATDVVVCGYKKYRIFTGPIVGGNFTSFETFTTNSEQVGIAADVDGDSDQDLILTDAGNLIVKFNVDGVHSSDTICEQAAPIYITTLDTLDVDNDGDLDLIAAAVNIDACYTIENDGNGYFTPLQSVSIPNPDTGHIIDIVGADLNNDGYGDAAALWYHKQDNATGLIAPVLSIMMNDGTGTLSYTTTRYYAEFARKLQAADFDNDGDCDLALNSGYPIGAAILLNDGSGEFSATEIAYAALGPGGPALQITANDFDLNGGQDIAVFQDKNANTNTIATIALLYNTMSSGYNCGDVNDDNKINVGDAVFMINDIFRGGPEPQPFCKGDVNGDGLYNVGDSVYLINNIFKGGPPPLSGCCP